MAEIAVELTHVRRFHINLISSQSLVLALGSIAATVTGVYWTLHDDDLLRLALSNTPLSEIHSEDKRLFVEFLRLRERNSQDYSRFAANFRLLNPALYSVDSFANPEVIRTTSASVQQVAEADFLYAARLQKMEHDFRARMLRVDPGSDYLKVVVSRGLAEAATTTLQHEWLTSVVTLYSFAAQYVKEMHVDHAKLIFSDEGVRFEFARLLAVSERMHRHLLDNVQAGLDEQKKVRSAAGSTSTGR